MSGGVKDGCVGVETASGGSNKVLDWFGDMAALATSPGPVGGVGVVSRWVQ